MLKEILTRPQPRRSKPPTTKKPFVTAVVLAAGLSRRMGKKNKLLMPYKGGLVIHHTLTAICASRVDQVIVVTGHQRERVEQALQGINCRMVYNLDYKQGMASSLVCAAQACSQNSDAMLVCLGDMPDISKQNINNIVAAFDPENANEICIPMFAGKRGHPVLWSHRFFSAIAQLTGDSGAHHLIEEYSDLVVKINMPSGSVLDDIDTEDDYLKSLSKNSLL